MNAVPAYQRSGAQEVSRGFPPRVDVIRGRGTRTRSDAMPSSVIMAAVAAAIILTVVAGFAILRIAISTAAVAEATEAQQVSMQIDSARSAAAALDVSVNSLAGNAEMKEMAADMGMAAPASSDILTLDEDVVAIDDEGKLLLSDSIGRVSEAGQ